jgi:hypothetical protein
MVSQSLELLALQNSQLAERNDDDVQCVNSDDVSMKNKAQGQGQGKDGGEGKDLFEN